jgi:predicted nucleic acid-binding protein
MRTPKIYLETTVFNFVFADDAPDKKQDTLKLFEEIKQGKYEPYTSEYVLQELLAAPEPKQSSMIAIIRDGGITVLPADDETKRLAELYISEGVIPPKNILDASHIAATTVNSLDFIASFNFKHIVRRKTVTMTEVVNLREGYHRIGIFSPTEVIDHE